MQFQNNFAKSNLDADYKNSPDIIITDLRKNDIILLNFDIDVASLDPYFKGNR